MRSLRFRFPPRRRLVILAVVAGVAGTTVVASVNVAMVLGTKKDVTTVADAGDAQVAIVLGARAYPDGGMSPMLHDRVAIASQLYKDHKVRKVIVSGDHGTWAYDEPGTMRDALIADGVRPADVFTDHAGFDTWATMKRARRVFGVDSAIVVTQGFHLPRAIYPAHAAGLQVQGVASDLQGYGPAQRASETRELAARLKAFGSATVDAPVILGPKIAITGDGRASWGPEGPPS